MKKLEFKLGDFHPSNVSREYKPFDEISAVQKAQEIFDAWYSLHSVEHKEKLDQAEQNNTTINASLQISEINMNKQLEIETTLRQKLKELKKKSNARRNALRALEKALKLKTHEYNVAIELAKTMKARNLELLAEFELLESAFEEFKEIVKEQETKERKSWWKFW